MGDKKTNPHGLDDALLKLFHLIGHFIRPVLLSQHLARTTDIDHVDHHVPLVILSKEFQEL